MLLIPLIGLLASCTSVKTSTLSTPMHAPSAVINPIRADIEVDMNKKLSGESQSSYFLLFKVRGDRKFTDGLQFSGASGLTLKAIQYGKLKEAATYKAVAESGYDLVVHPTYVIEKRNFIFFSTVKMKVTGYAAKFKKFYQVPYDENSKKVDLKLDLKSSNN